MVSELETAVRADLAALIKEKNCHGIMVRVAWHDAGTFRPVLLSRSFCDDSTAYCATALVWSTAGRSTRHTRWIPSACCSCDFLSPFLSRPRRRLAYYSSVPLILTLWCSSSALDHCPVVALVLVVGRVQARTTRMTALVAPTARSASPPSAPTLPTQV